METVLHAEDGESGFLRGKRTISPWCPLRLQVLEHLALSKDKLPHGHRAEPVVGGRAGTGPPCSMRGQHAVCSPIGHPFGGWPPDQETGASCLHARYSIPPRGPAGPPRAADPLSALRDANTRQGPRSVRGRNLSASKKAAGAETRSGAHGWGAPPKPSKGGQE